MDLGESMASAMDSEESIAEQLAKLQEQIDFKTRKLADLRAENGRKAQELREKKSKLVAIKHLQHQSRISVIEFIQNIPKIAAAKEACKAMTDTVNEVIKAYEGRMMKQVQDQYLNTVVLANILREESRKMWQKHLDEFPLD